MCTCGSLLLSDKCLDGWIGQKHTISESGRVQNRGIKQSGHRNEKGENRLLLASRNWSSDQDLVVNKEVVLYS